MTYPPRPNNISIPAVIAGNILQNDDTSISAIDSGFDGSLVMKTENTIAMIIDQNQHVSINTESLDSMLTINNDVSTSPTLRLSYQDSYYFDGRITSNGNMLFTPNCDDVVLNTNLTTTFQKNVDIADHDGVLRGLRLGGSLITASASEINYVDTIKGIATANKAVILDGNKSFTGLTNLSSTNITGTLTSGPQPNITSINDLNITGVLSIQGTPFNIDLDILDYIDTPNEGIAYAQKALILDSSKSITGITNLSSTNLTGTLTSGPQPNITSLSALNSLTNNGVSTFNNTVTITTANSDMLKLRYNATNYGNIGVTNIGDLILTSSSNTVKIGMTQDFQILGHDGITTGLVLGSVLVTATATQLNYNTVTPGTALANRSMVLDASRNITNIGSLAASSLSGTLQTPLQPNITSVNTLNIVMHNGSTTGLSLNGTLVTATASKLNYIDTTPGSAQVSKAIVLNSLGDVSGINSFTASKITGTLQTEIQPNIKTVNTLTITGHDGATQGLILGSTLVTATATQFNALDVTSGTAVAERALVVDGAKNIVGISNLSANTISGTILTPFQPNISSLTTLNVTGHDGGLNGLKLGGILVESTAFEINRVHTTAGIADVNKAMILDSSKSITGINILSANTLGGTLTTATQLNIRNVETLNLTNHNGSTVGLALNGILVKSTANQLNYLTVSPGTATANKAIVLNSSGDVSGINSITSNNIYGIIRTITQPYIERVNILNILNHDGGTQGLSLGNVLITATAAQINKINVNEGFAAASKALILSSTKTISGINSIAATTLLGTIGTSSQPNITSVNTLNIVTHNGATVGLSLGGTIVTSSASDLNRVDVSAGVAAATKALITDANNNISGINSLTSVNLTGIIQTSSQPNITSVNTLDITNHDGGSNGLKLNGTLISSTANQLNYVTVVPGIASSTRALVTNEFNSITGINSLNATKVIASELSLSGVISNFNTGGVVIKSYSFTDLTGRIIDTQLLSGITFSNFQPGGLTDGYSSEIIGYILPQYSETYTFYVTCTDKTRMWIDDTLILHSWVTTPSIRTSSTIFLNANQWTPIYIQYQVNTGSNSNFVLEWQSNNTIRGAITASRLAWDNNITPNTRRSYIQNQIMIYNSSTTTQNSTTFTVDTGGDLIIDASGNDINLGNNDNLNIPVHDGITKGLFLGGVLVQPTAYELNYLKVSPGITTASHALIVDASKSITGINSLSATSISCTNLTTSAFTISNLTLSGPLNNYNTGTLLIRQITGSNVSGRVVNVDTISEINLTNYDPRDLTTNFSLDIIGYIKPMYTEPFRFHAIANDRVRIWVNNVLILNVWDSSTGIEYTSDAISLVAGSWVPIYIQFQNISGTSGLRVRWSSTSLTKSDINTAYIAWDNANPRIPKELSIANTMTLYNTSSGLTSIQTGNMSVDSNGIMYLSSKSLNVSVSDLNNFNIIGHNGTNTGLKLSGSLVTAIASELNRLSGVVPGTVVASKAIVLDSNKSLSGLTTISTTDIYGTLRSPSQPYITEFGALSAPLNTSSSIVMTNTNVFRLYTDNVASYIQSGSSATSDAAADIFIGNYGTTTSTSSRKIMIKSSGFTGIQTNNPMRALTVNGGGSTYAMRIVNNNSTGTETNYIDIGCDTSSNLKITSNLILGNVGTSTMSVSASGVMKIAPSGNSLQIGNTTNTDLPLEIGSNTFDIETTVGYLNDDGSVGTFIPSETTYSLRTTSSIIVNGTVCVTSDKRLKQDIYKLNENDSKQFIMESEPIQFKYRNDLSRTHYGLIAQNVAKSQFSSLVGLSIHEDIDEEVDEDGFISPENIALNVSYDEIIPILMTTMKSVITENQQLKNELTEMKDRIAKLERLIFK